MVNMPLIDQAKCNQCGLCVEVCTCGAIIFSDNKVVIIETNECHWCTTCEAVCPTSALTCSFEIIFDEG